MKIIIASNNSGKVNEFKMYFDNVYSLNDLNIEVDVEETGVTLEENALLKAQAIFKLFPNDLVIADDTGLFVYALDLKPGVRSARFALDHNSSKSISDYLLEVMEDIVDRRAYFKTCLCCLFADQVLFVDGILEGDIALESRVNNGFGYDSVFLVNDRYLSDFTLEEKNLSSHRAKALVNLKIELKKLELNVNSL